MKLDYIQWNNLYYLCEKLNHEGCKDEHVGLQLKQIWQNEGAIKEVHMPYYTWLRYLVFNKDFVSMCIRFPFGAACIKLYVDEIMASESLTQRGNISLSL